MQAQSDLLPSIFAAGFNIEVDCATNGSNTLYAVPDGRRLLVFTLMLQSEGDVVCQLRSGSTDLTGPIDFTATAGRERTFQNAPFPVFKTVATGDDLILNLSAGVQINGFGFATLVDM